MHWIIQRQLRGETGELWWSEGQLELSLRYPAKVSKRRLESFMCQGGAISNASPTARCPATAGAGVGKHAPIREHLAQRDSGWRRCPSSRTPGRQAAWLRWQSHVGPDASSRAQQKRVFLYRYQRYGDLCRTLHRPDSLHGRCRAVSRQRRAATLRSCSRCGAPEPAQLLPVLSGRQRHPPAPCFPSTFTCSTPATDTTSGSVRPARRA